jgi:hypothetical protein
MPAVQSEQALCHHGFIVRVWRAAEYILLFLKEKMNFIVLLRGACNARHGSVGTQLDDTLECGAWLMVCLVRLMQSPTAAPARCGKMRVFRFG